MKLRFTRVDGATVVVSSPSVPKPVAVRYAWQPNPRATLCNGAGLPAEPFRTDDWPEMTARHETYGNDPTNQGLCAPPLSTQAEPPTSALVFSTKTIDR